MDDLAATLQNLLSTKEGQEQLKNIQSLLGMSGQGSNQSPPPPEQQNGSNNAKPAQGGLDFSALLNALGGGQQNNNQNSPFPPNAPADGGGPNIDMGTILKLQQVFQNMNVNDKNSQLLLALKPHFGERRRAKVDQAISMIRLLSMLPMLKESGLFSGL